jgi:CelD/BcsL family acetyltransferase involved in cellulose biosynthesis
VRVDVIHARELSPDLRAAWTNAQGSHEQFSSPFFCPEFTAAVGAVRDDVRIALLESDGAAGFFPFELAAPRVGRPAGGRLSDYQGVIAPPELQWNAEELLQHCELDRYHYKRLIGSQQQFQAYHSAFACSVLMDLGGGFDAYAERLRLSGSGVLNKVAAYRRCMNRDVGPVRYEACSNSAEVRRWLFACKSSQYLRTGYDDKFQTPWIRNLLELLHTTGDAVFGGMLSVLWAGDRIAAAHLGLRWKDTLHYWWPCYDTRLGRYSPGLILLVEMARRAALSGISQIDLGRLDAPYKRRFMTGNVAIAEGVAIAKAPQCGETESGRANLARV